MSKNFYFVFAGPNAYTRNTYVKVFSRDLLTEDEAEYLIRNNYRGITDNRILRRTNSNPLNGKYYPWAKQGMKYIQVFAVGEIERSPGLFSRGEFLRNKFKNVSMATVGRFTSTAPGAEAKAAVIPAPETVKVLIEKLKNLTGAKEVILKF